MKIILKPLKWILSIIIAILIVPVTLLIIMYKSVTPPTTETTGTLNTMVIEEVDHFIDEDNNDKKLSLGFSSDILNTEIKKKLLEQVGSENQTDDYIYEDENIKFQGAWVEFGKDKIDIQVGLHVNARIMTYKTRVLLSFDFKEVNENTEEIILKLNKINLGNLPLAWLSKVAPSIIKTVTGQDVEKFAKQAVEKFGELDLKKRELRVDIDKLATMANENEELVKLVLDLTLKNGLIKLGVDNEDDKLGIMLDLNKIKDDAKLDVVLDRINSHDELEMYLKTKALEGLLNGNNKISFDKKAINEIVDFLFTGGQLETILLKQAIYEDYEVIVDTPFISISDKLDLIVPIRIGKDTNYFKTAITIGVELSKVDMNLVFDLKTLTIGELEFEEEAIETLLSNFQNEELNFTNNQFVVNGFFEMFDMEGITFTGVSVLNNQIHFEYESDLLDDIFQVISDLIGIDPDITDAATDILDKINNNIDVTSDVEDFIELIDALDEEEKQKIIDLINQGIN